MIICKPKNSTLISLGIFAFICYAALFFLLLDASYRIAHPPYFTPLVWSLTGIALLVTLRLAFGYRTIVASNGKIIVKQKFLFRHRKFDLKQLVDWEEIVIKTLNGEYKQLKLQFSHGKLSVSKQEYTDYEKLKSYVIQKAGVKKAIK
ncbi:MAG: hypothetical protein V4714_20450 [Bacteroidota bacterium]